MNTGLSNLSVFSLNVSGTNLFAGTWAGVFLSTNNGTSWTAVNNGLPNINAGVCAFAVSGTNLFAGTYVGGVWRRPLSEMITDVEEVEQLPNNFTLKQNCPNPFNPSTKISWLVPVGSWQTLKVYDVLGNEVATLVNEYKLAGSYEVEFSTIGGAVNLPSGVYFYRIQAGDFIQTKKLVLMK